MEELVWKYKNNEENLREKPTNNLFSEVFGMHSGETFYVLIYYLCQKIRLGFFLSFILGDSNYKQFLLHFINLIYNLHFFCFMLTIYTQRVEVKFMEIAV